MKYLLLILLVICVAAGLSLRDRVIVIQLVLPSDLLPYYDWLLSWPGFNTPSGSPGSPDTNPDYDTNDI